MRKVVLFLFFVFVATFCFGQIKEQFTRQLVEDSTKRDFAERLLILERLVAKGVDRINIDSLQKEPGFYFLEQKKKDGQTLMIFNLTWPLKTVYNRLEDAGKIKRLKALRLAGKLKILARGIANEVEPPKKTNPRQSYNDFYLEVIQKMLQANSEALKADKLDFATYKAWEKEAGLTSSLAIRQYRESFIIFLYKHYNFR